MVSLYEPDILIVESAFDQVLGALVDITDDDVRGRSRLPGWTRAHVITHLARNADGNRNIVEGALDGEERAQYPGGVEQRAGEIDAGARRSPYELMEDLRVSQSALVDRWRALTDAQWSCTGVWLSAGRQSIDASVPSRRRELLVHVVDLDLGVHPSDLPADFVAEERAWLAEHRTRETWPDARW